jgi:predicted RNase H-like nuclease (RuvC/YqgF family)
MDWNPRSEVSKAIKSLLEEKEGWVFTTGELQKAVSGRSGQVSGAVCKLVEKNILMRVNSKHYKLSDQVAEKIASHKILPEGIKKEMSSIEVGNAVIDLVQDLREEIEDWKEKYNHLKGENEELSGLLDTYGRLEEENAALREKITKLTTQQHASNAKKLTF